MRTRTQVAVWGAVVVASLGLHAVAFGGLGRAGWGSDPAARKRKPASVDFSVNEKKPVAPAPEEPKVVEHKQRVAMARPAAKAAAPAPSPAPPPAAESPADFTGQTLTNEGPGEGWASATGNGQKMNGPVGRPGAHVTRRVVDGDENGTGNGPRVVGLGDLSKAPTAPDLTDALATAYPADARAKGVAGKAVVKARITPDGKVRELAVISESTAGFGAACEQTLRGSAWSPPLDRHGQAVSTYINYTCRFNVE
ncbi:MAG: Ferric siderophore transport system, periplasmic binding protein TonB [Myxococcales bacterium]|nr:Ferric siderophore transport system, periplasmic binding protein TonB [Myxococcales bacterium]